jgi:tRNA (guanine-N7-)-methyltransferase
VPEQDSASNQNADMSLHNDVVHSYIRRRGRFTKAQASALERLAQHYRMSTEAINTDLRELGIEIGFGMGHELIIWGQEQPQKLLLGIELYQPGIGSMLSRLENLKIGNVALVDEPAQKVLAELTPKSVSEIRIFFPDPWPKKRHLKRRLIQPEFLEQMLVVLKPMGIARLATDWAEYGEWMAEHFAMNTNFKCELDAIRDPILAESGLTTSLDSLGAVRGRTKFETRGEKLGHRIRDFTYRRVS